MEALNILYFSSVFQSTNLRDSLRPKRVNTVGHDVLNFFGGRLNLKSFVCLFKSSGKLSSLVLKCCD